jgi:hypothetical protein
MDQVSIPAPADGLKVIGTIAAPYALKNGVLFMVALRWD